MKAPPQEHRTENDRVDPGYPVNAKGQRICGASRKQGGGICLRFPAKGRTRCKLHGGASRQGMAHPNYKDGRYAQTIPAHLRERYLAALNDDDLLRMDTQFALLDARVQELLGQLAQEDVGASWRRVRTDVASLKRAVAAKDDAGRDQALGRIDAAIAAGIDQMETWSAVLATVDQQRKIVESEAKRQTAMGRIVTVDQFVIALNRIGDVIRRRVKDRDTLDEIAAEIRVIVGGGAS